MKKILTALMATAICGSYTMGLDATNAQVTLPKLSSLEFYPISTSTSSFATVLSTGKKVRAKRGNAAAWNFIIVPIKIEGKCKGGAEPNYVDALSVKLSILIDKGRDVKPLLLTKTLDYAEVPVGTVNVGALISPSMASKLTGTDEKAGDGDLKHKILGVAVEATFKGESCMATDAPFAYVFDAAMEKKLSSKWWTSSLDSDGIELRAINETPFAPFYASQYPALKDIYATGSSKSSSSKN